MMLRWIARVLQRLSRDTIKLFLLAMGILLLWGTLAPVGTLIWWLNHKGEDLGLKKQPVETVFPSDRSASASGTPEINCYIVFLSGIGDFSANQLTRGEEFFFDRLVKRHPLCVTVSDVFPYSLRYRGLGGEQMLAPLWQAAKKARHWSDITYTLVNIRNLWRFALSADERYGRIYNQGIAATIRDRMNAAHPISTSPQQLKLILIGASGGVQVALGAATYLNQWLDAQLFIVSLGGAFDGNTGFKAVDQMYHLQGRRDWVEDVCRVVFASRWRWIVGSPFNQARRQGRYKVQTIGSHTHDGEQGYFGLAIAQSNTPYVELTLQAVNQLPIWSDREK